MEKIPHLPQKIRPTLLLAFAAIYLIWGSTYLAIRIAIHTIPPFLMAGVRFLIAGVVLYGVLRVAGVARPPAAQIRAAGWIGVLMMCGGNGLVTWSEQIVPSGLAALMVAAMPLWMVGLDATFFGGDKPGPKIIAGLLMGMAGVATLIGPAEGAVHPLGAAVLLLATLSWALGSLRSRSAAMPRSPWMSAAIQMIVGGVVLVGAATVTGEWQRLDVAAISSSSLWAFLYLVIFGSIVALSAYLYLLRETSAAAVGTYAFVNPVIALALGWWVGEVINMRSLVGGVLVIGAVLLIHWQRTRGESPPEDDPPEDDPPEDAVPLETEPGIAP